MGATDRIIMAYTITLMKNCSVIIMYGSKRRLTSDNYIFSIYIAPFIFMFDMIYSLVISLSFNRDNINSSDHIYTYSKVY